MNTEVFLY